MKNRQQDRTSGKTHLTDQITERRQSQAVAPSEAEAWPGGTRELLSMRQITIVTVTTIAGLAVSYVTGLPLFVGFSAGLLLLAAMLLRAGHAFHQSDGSSDLPRAVGMREVLRTAWLGALHTREVVYILLFVGMLIPAWSASGTIDAMIGAGVDLFVPTYFLTCAFLLSGVISFLLGTSTGTLSAVGIPVIGMALHLGVPLPMAAGALVSGAFVGDRGSPFSSAFRLVADSAGISTRKLGKAMLPTTAAGLIASLLFFGVADYTGDWHLVSSGAVPFGALNDGPPSLWLFLPPALLIVTMLLRLGTKTAFIMAIISAIVIGSLESGIAVSDWWSILWNGWTSITSDGSIHTSTAVSGMVELVTLIALAGSFNGLLELSGGIEPIVRRIFGLQAITVGSTVRAEASGSNSFVVSNGRAVEATFTGTANTINSNVQAVVATPNLRLAGATWRAGVFGLGLGLVSCTQTLPIMMTGRHLRAIWIPRFGAAHLGRVVADTSLLLAALVPWNMLAIICSTIIGVPVIDYLPYAIYIWSIPLFTLAFSWLVRVRSIIHK